MGTREELQNQVQRDTQLDKALHKTSNNNHDTPPPHLSLTFLLGIQRIHLALLIIRGYSVDEALNMDVIYLHLHRTHLLGKG